MTDPFSPGPAISVILPVRNRAAIVEAAARCVLDQTWRDLELIIVDGGSTDGTVAVLKGLAAADPRVRLLLHDRAEGVAAARNAAARLARGRFLAFQDSDDSWSADKMQRQMTALHALPGARMAYTGCLRHFPGGTRRTPNDWDAVCEGDLFERLLRGPLMNAPTLLIEKALFDEVGGFDEQLNYHEDWDLAVRCSAVTKIACAKDWLVESPQLPDSLTRDVAAFRGAMDHLLAKHERMLRRFPKVHEYRLARVAFINLAARRPGGGRLLRRALGVRPASLHWPTARAAWSLLRGRRWT